MELENFSRSVAPPVVRRARRHDRHRGLSSFEVSLQLGNLAVAMFQRGAELR
jgi:hypothetical protein